jgi:hypothetical protein
MLKGYQMEQEIRKKSYQPLSERKKLKFYIYGTQTFKKKVAQVIEHRFSQILYSS